MRSSVVYEFTCPIDGCHRYNNSKRSYVGHTQCCLSKRLSGHLQEGAIKFHFESEHGANITRSQIVDNTVIRFTEHDVRRLKVLESLVIKLESPSLNIQETGQTRILKLY